MSNDYIYMCVFIRCLFKYLLQTTQLLKKYYTITIFARSNDKVGRGEME